MDSQLYGSARQGRRTSISFLFFLNQELRPLRSALTSLSAISMRSSSSCPPSAFPIGPGMPSRYLICSLSIASVRRKTSASKPTSRGMSGAFDSPSSPHSFSGSFGSFGRFFASTATPGSDCGLVSFGSSLRSPNG